MKKLLLPFLLLPLLVRAADQDPQAAINARLREGLKNTMLQLRDAQTQLAAAQAAQADTAAKLKELQSRFDALAKQSAADKQTADKTYADLKALNDSNVAEIARLNLSLSKWKEGYGKLMEVAKDKESQRAKLAQEKILLTRQLAAATDKNRALFALGQEILARYQRFGLGDALTAREPFVQSTKVKFQNLIQDFSDKLSDSRLKDQ